MSSEPGPFWTLERRPLLQYVKLLVSAALQGKTAEVSWFLRNAPADLSDLQPEAFHCALLVAVLKGHHSTAEALLQHQNPDRQLLILPVCSCEAESNLTRRARPGPKPAGMDTSFLALSYGWDTLAGYVSKEDHELSCKRNDSLCSAQYLGMMRLLLEYGVAPASAMQGLLQKLAITADIAAAKLLQAHNFNLGDCVLSDGQTMLHLLVSAQCHNQRYNQSGTFLSGSASRDSFEEDIKEWQDQAMPLLQLLLSTEGATIKRDDNNKTAMDVCMKQCTKFMSAMQNARLSAQPVRRGNSEAAQAHCVICMDRQPSVVIIPCGHLCVCQPCAGRVQQQCPVCRGAATQLIQTFTP